MRTSYNLPPLKLLFLLVNCRKGIENWGVRPLLGARVGFGRWEANDVDIFSES